MDFYVPGATPGRGYPPGWEVSRDVDVVAFEAGGAASLRTLQECLVKELGARPDLVASDAEGWELWAAG